MTPRELSWNDAVAEAGHVAVRSADRTAWIGIDGFGAAGKSSLAAAIAVQLRRVTVVRTDDFWGPDVREWDWGRFRAQVLLPLLRGRRARYQVWDWDADQGGDWVEIAPGTVVVVEGVSSTRSEAGVPWDLTIWVDAPEEVRLRRAIERDGTEMLERWLADWMPSEQAYAARERPMNRVDVIVVG